MQQQQPGRVTHSRISSLLISRHLTGPRAALRYSGRDGLKEEISSKYERKCWRISFGSVIIFPLTSSLFLHLVDFGGCLNLKCNLLCACTSYIKRTLPMRARVLRQKSEEATASSALLLATPLCIFVILYCGGVTVKVGTRK